MIRSVIRLLSVIILIDIDMIRSVIINTVGGRDKATSHIVLVSFVHCRLKKNASCNVNVLILQRLLLAIKKD